MISILFLTHHPEQDASSRYRVYQYLPLLEQNGFRCEVRPFSTKYLFRMLRNGGSPFTKIAHTFYCGLRRGLDILRLHRYDLIVIHREVFPFFAPCSEKLVFFLHKRVIFNLDDAVYVGHDRNSLQYSWLYKFKYQAGLNEVFSMSRLVIAGSPVIADHVRKFSPDVEVIPTVVDLRRYVYVTPRDFEDGPITIGWYGSNSTSPYLHEIVPALQRLSDAHYGRIRFRFFGDIKLFLDLPHLEVLPFKLETEIEDLRSMDIGLMPLPDTVWAHAKCAFKAIQYMALGIPTVVTPIGMSAQVVRDNETGLHATSTEEWFAQLHLLVGDLALRRRLAIAARKEVEEEYSLQRWATPFVATLRRVHETAEAMARMPSAKETEKPWLSSH